MILKIAGLWKLFLFMFLSLLSSLSLADTEEEYLQDARSYLEKGDLNAAIIQFKNAVKKAPKHGEARFSLGQAYLLKGEVRGAEKELLHAQRLGVEDEKVVPLLGRAYLIQGNAKKVLDELAIKDNASTKLKVVLHELRGQAFLMLGEKAKARGEYNDALKIDSMSSGALLGQARLAAMEGKLDAGLKKTEQVIKGDPQNAEAWTLRGEILRQKGDLEEAGKYFEKAIAMQSRHVPARLGLATTQLALGRDAEAKFSINAVLEIIPNSPHANHLKAMLMVREGDLNAAKELLQGVLRILPDYMPSQQLLAGIHFSQGQYGQAEYLLNRVVNSAPNNLHAKKLLAATYIKLNQGKKAITILEDVKPLPESDAQFLGLLGSAYMQVNNLEKGTDYLEKAAAAAPNAAAIRTQLALGRLASGDMSAAVKDLKKAVGLNQNVVQADVLLIMVHLKNKEFNQALDQAKELSGKLPKSPLPHNLIGAAYVGLRQVKEAENSFEEALKVDPTFSPARMNLARLAEERGEKEKAEQYYERVLKSNSAHEGAYLSLARIAGQSGDHEKMRELLEASWEKNNGAIKSGLALVEYYNRTKQSMRAVGVAREIKNKHPKSPVAFRMLGSSQMQAKDFYGAKGTFATWVSMDEASAEARYFLGQAERALGETAKAKVDLQKAIKLLPDFLPAQLALSAIYIEQKEYTAVMDIAREIKQQRPENPAGYRLEGDIYVQKGDFKNAIKAYSTGLKNAPTSVLVLSEFEARKKSGDKKAIKVLVGWLSGHMDDDAVRTVLAGAYQQNGNLEKAEKEYRYLLARAPKNVVILNNLAWVADKLNRPDALRLANKAYDLSNNSPAIMDTYGWLLVKSGNQKKGVDILQQAVSLAPHIAEIRYHYGIGLYKLGRKKEAKYELVRALEISEQFSGADDAMALVRDM